MDNSIFCRGCGFQIHDKDYQEIGFCHICDSHYYDYFCAGDVAIETNN